MSSSGAGAFALTALFVGTLLCVPAIFVMREVAMRRARNGSLRARRARAWLELSSIGLLVLGLLNVVIALPLLHPDFVVAPIVREAALPVAYVAVAAGAAMRLLTTRFGDAESAMLPARDGLSDTESALGE